VRPESLFDFYMGTSIGGAVSYVKFGKEVARVPDNTVEKIKLLVTKGDTFEVTPASFAPGQFTMIHHGSLTGLTCEVVQLKGKQKILVRVNLLQRNLLVDMPAHYLAPALPENPVYSVSSTY
jgi:hypothetical protein